jgi:starch synthase
MRILHISSEVAPLSKTGGLADVAGALPRALAALGHEVAVVTPCYRSILADPMRHGLAKRLRRVVVPLGRHQLEVGVYEGRLGAGRGEVKLWLIDHPVYDRAGLYNEAGVDYPDNALRFALLARGADILARTFGFDAEVLHAHDWQGALGLMFAQLDPERARAVRTVLTIHNLAFLGLFPPSVVEELGLGNEVFHPEGLEFYGQVSLLKAGIQYADRVTTVSPRYAEEIQTPELGCGLDGLLRQKADRLVGILNGIDYDVWNPARDPALASHYDLIDPPGLGGKRACKAALQRLVGLPERPRVPLVGAVSRLSDQKGFDLVAEVLEGLLAERELQVVVLGSADAGAGGIEERLAALARRFPTKLAVRTGYDEPLAHRIYGGADLFVMPSRYEPCGLGQMYALRYGAVPIVRATGGLDDTVVDYDPRSRTGTGFKFKAYSAEALGAIWRRALAAYGSDEGWTPLARRGMQQDYSWAASARSYVALYRSIPR